MNYLEVLLGLMIWIFDFLMSLEVVVVRSLFLNVFVDQVKENAPFFVVEDDEPKAVVVVTSFGFLVGTSGFLVVETFGFLEVETFGFLAETFGFFVETSFLVVSLFFDCLLYSVIIELLVVDYLLY